MSTRGDRIAARGLMVQVLVSALDLSRTAWRPIEHLARSLGVAAVGQRSGSDAAGALTRMRGAASLRRSPARRRIGHMSRRPAAHSRSSV